MRCKCNPSRAELGGWQGVCRCAVCGKIFYDGWKCRPKCQPPVEEDCPPECEIPIQEDCMPKHELSAQGEAESEEPIRQKEWEAECEPPAQCEPECEPPDQQGELLEFLTPEAPDEIASEEQCWPMSNLTDQLPRDPH